MKWIKKTKKKTLALETSQSSSVGEHIGENIQLNWTGNGFLAQQGSSDYWTENSLDCAKMVVVKIIIMDDDDFSFKCI